MAAESIAPTVLEEKRKPLWSPLAVGLSCFFFTFLVAGLLNAISYKRMGYKEKGNVRMLFVVVGFMIFTVLAFITSTERFALFTGFHTATILYFSHDQKKLYAEHIEKGGENARIIIPLILGLILIILWSGCLLVYRYKDSDSAKLVNYVNVDLQLINEQEAQVDVLTQQYNVETTPEGRYQLLKNQLVPAMEQVNETAAAVNPESDDVRDLHGNLLKVEGLKLKVLKKEMKVRELLIPPITTEDRGKVRELITEEQRLSKQFNAEQFIFQKKMVQLVKKYDVQMNIPKHEITGGREI